MARDARGRYTARVVGRGRRLRIVDGRLGLTGTEVGGVVSGEPIYISGGPDADEADEPKRGPGRPRSETNS